MCWKSGQKLLLAPALVLPVLVISARRTSGYDLISMQRGGVGGAYPTGSGASISYSPQTQPSFTSSGIGASPLRRTALPLVGARSGQAIVVAVAVGFVFVFVIVVVVGFVVVFVIVVVAGFSFAFDMVLVDVVVVVVALAGAAVAFEVGAVVATALLEVESFLEAHAVMEQRTSVMRVRFMPRNSTTEALWTHPMQIF